MKFAKGTYSSVVEQSPLKRWVVGSNPTGCTMVHPKNLSTNDIVTELLENQDRRFTESAHAEIFRRLIDTINNFNQKAEKTEKIMLLLALSQVILAATQIFLALYQK